MSKNSFMNMLGAKVRVISIMKMFFVLSCAICICIGQVVAIDDENERTTRVEAFQNIKKHIGGLDGELKKTREVLEEFLKEFRKSAELSDVTSSTLVKENALKNNKVLIDNIERLVVKMEAFENTTKDINQSVWREINCIKSSKDNELSVTRQRARSKSDFKVICYFPSYSFYKHKAEEKFYPEKIDPALCSHVIYAFLSLNPNTSLVYSKNNYLDLEQRFYERVTDLKLKKPSLKVLISLGGWTDSKGDKYSRLVNDSSKRARFVEHVTSYLKENNFDGLDLDWEYPVCWQANCSEGPTSDKENFSLLLEELRAEFDRQEPRLILTAAVSAYAPQAGKSYDIKRIAKSLDLISVMAYNLAGPWHKITGHHSALYMDGDGNLLRTADYAMQYWARKGVPKKKLIMGVPAYGKNFTLVSKDENNIGAPTTNHTYPNSLPYYQICKKVKYMNWTKEYVERVGPYTYFDTQWISYDDVRSMTAKAEYIKQNEYGGIMIWNLAHDDFNALCCNETYPLLKAINNELFDIGIDPRTFGCE